MQPAIKVEDQNIEERSEDGKSGSLQEINKNIPSKVGLNSILKYSYALTKHILK